MPAASKPEHPSLSVGEATHITYREGGDWYEWYPNKTGLNRGLIFSVKFDSGWIWDAIVGWRKPR